MPFEVKMSQFASRTLFEDAVKKHIDRLHAFNREVGKPRPVAHPLVEASIKRIQVRGQPDRYEPNYTIVDDTPPPPLAASLEQKKQKLVGDLLNAENAAKFKHLPQRKMRLMTTKVQIAMAKLEEQRSLEDHENIVVHQDMSERWRAIELIGAQAESDIDDLTEETVDTWKPPTFE